MAKHIKSLILEPIAATLKSARARKGLSQRALSEKVGAPQSHISKIENGEVDLQTSSLIEIARALDLELTLIPRSLIPAIRALQPAPQTWVARATNSSLQALMDSLSKQALRQPLHSKIKALRILTETLKDLAHLPLQPAQENQLYILLDRVRREIALLRSPRMRPGAQPAKEQIQVFDRAVRDLRTLRNAIVHGGFPPAAPQPAYRLDEESEDA